MDKSKVYTRENIGLYLFTVERFSLDSFGILIKNQNMNRYVFYTFEGFTESPSNAECENIQILGFENGSNLNEAKSTLIAENGWIKELGFNADEIHARQLLTDENKETIKTAVDCLWDDEKKHFEENATNDSSSISVILEKLQELIDA